MRPRKDWAAHKPTPETALMTQPLMSLSATMVVGAIGGVGAMERWEKKKIYRDKTDKQNEATGNNWDL